MALLNRLLLFRLVKKSVRYIPSYKISIYHIFQLIVLITVNNCMFEHQHILSIQGTTTVKNKAVGMQRIAMLKMLILAFTPKITRTVHFVKKNVVPIHNVEHLNVEEFTTFVLGGELVNVIVVRQVFSYITIPCQINMA